MNQFLDLYRYYLISQNKYATSTESLYLGHDKILRLWNNKLLGSKEFIVLPETSSYISIEKELGALILYYVIQEKLCTDENQIIRCSIPMLRNMIIYLYTYFM